MSCIDYNKHPIPTFTWLPRLLGWMPCTTSLFKAPHTQSKTIFIWIWVIVYRAKLKCKLTLYQRYTSPRIFIIVRFKSETNGVAASCEPTSCIMTSRDKRFILYSFNKLIMASDPANRLTKVDHDVTFLIFQSGEKERVACTRSSMRSFSKCCNFLRLCDISYFGI